MALPRWVSLTHPNTKAQNRIRDTLRLPFVLFRRLQRSFLGMP